MVHVKHNMALASQQAIAAVTVDIRLARFACGLHLGRAAESQRRSMKESVKTGLRPG